MVKQNRILIMQILFWAISIILYVPAKGSVSTDAIKKASKIHIEIVYQQWQKGDTLGLFFVNRYYAQVTERRKKFYATAIKDSLFCFDIPVSDSCGYFDINVNKSELYPDTHYRPISKCFFWEKGDSVRITINNREQYTGINSKIIFEGKGVGKYLLRYKVLDEKDGFVKKHVNSGTNLFVNIDLNRKQLMTEMKKELSPFSYNVLTADLIFMKASEGYRLFFDTVEKVKDERKLSVGFNIDDVLNIPPDAIASSMEVFPYLYKKLRYDSFLATGHINDLWVYEQIKEITNIPLRDGILTYNFAQGRNGNKRDSLLSDAIKVVQSQESLSELNYLKSIGRKQNFYSYVLKDKNGNDFSLQKYKGRYLIVDFWTYGCGPCHALYENVLSKAIAFYHSNQSIQFISVNGDKSKLTRKKGIESGLYAEAKGDILYSEVGYSDKLFSDFNVTKYPTLLVIGRRGELIYYDNSSLYELNTFKTTIADLLSVGSITSETK